MNSFYNFLEEISSNTKIPFAVKCDGKIEFSSINNKSDYKNENIYNYIDVKGKHVEIITLKEYKNCISLLNYLIKDKLESFIVSKEEIIKSILTGENIDFNLVENKISFLKNAFYVINIYLQGDLKDGEDLIKASYEDSGIISTVVNNNIVVIGKFNDIKEHINGINESIISNLYDNCYISYSRAKGIEEMIEAFHNNEMNIYIATKYDLQESIYKEEDLLLETIIHNMDSNFKDKLYKKFNPKFKKLDSELIRTIDIFFSCGTNLSEASKNLYVHRNTLIYRLDKIQKYTSYDIRNFKDANIFKIAYLICKEKIMNKS